MATQPVVEPWKLLTIGANFPPGLNTADEATAIGVDETPDAYGFDLTKDGVIAKGTIPSGTARVENSFTVTEGALSVPYLLHYGRMWNITDRTAATPSNILTYGAYGYDNVYVPFKSGKVVFNEDAQPILNILPVGLDELLVLKSTGSYVYGNLNDSRGFWPKSDIMQEFKPAAASRCLELDATGFVSSATGLWAYGQGGSQELTRKVRNDLTNFGSVALLADYEKKYIRGGTSYIYEVPTQKLFRWSGTSFRYTTKQFHLPDWAPFTVDRIIATLRHTDEEDGWFTYQVKYESGDWSEEENVNTNYEADQYTDVGFGMPTLTASRRFQLRITDMSSNLVFKQFRLDGQDWELDSYSA